MVTRADLHSDLPIPPGEYLAEAIQEYGLSQAELARRMGRPPQAINEIIKGEKAITPETALQLEQVIGVPAHIWTGLESEYRLVKARQGEEASVEGEASQVGDYPYAEMARLGWVKAARKASDKVRELRRFFGVASLANIPNVAVYQPAFRQATRRSVSPHALAAWLRQGESLARGVPTEPFDAARLRAALPALRDLTRESPETFLPRLHELLAGCGVVLVLLPHLPRTYANGATFWLAQRKAVVMMSLRGGWADLFWFSLCHELGHILLHDKRLTFLEDGAANPHWQEQENEADAFARDTLIPAADYDAFIRRGQFSGAAVREFADRVGIAPGVVAGRLQHEGRLRPDHLNGLRNRYQWAS